MSRAFVVTNAGVYHCEDKGGKLLVKRRTPLSEVEGVSLSNLSDDFVVVHCRAPQVDYLLQTDKKTILTTCLVDACKRNNRQLNVQFGNSVTFRSAKKAYQGSFDKDESADNTFAKG